MEEAGNPDPRERWSLILGASSGFGEASAVALAQAGYRIIGIHRDPRSALPHLGRIRQRITAAGSEALYLNLNAADDEMRAFAIGRIRARFAERRDDGADPYLRVVVHSMAFGTLLPYIAENPREAVNRKQMETTLDVMANSLVYWIQDLLRAGLIGRGTHVFATTSEGSVRAARTYGPVSAAKAALESHCRQLAAELGRMDTGITVNAIRAGVTVTPALVRIPEHRRMIEGAKLRNPSGRLTTPQDIGSAIVRLSEDGLEWVTGNVIAVDGGESISW